LIGSHRDAWDFGAVDPISGHSVTMETARVFGQLIASGWKPRRSIMFCSWDAEEYGLIGSVEFCEQWEKTLTSKAVIYINLDQAVSGGDIFSVGGSPSLQNITTQILNEVTLNSQPLINYWQPQQFNYLSSSSDYTAFLQHLGIPSIDMGLSSANNTYSAVYHSIFDSYTWSSKFADSTFENHAAICRTAGLLALNFIDSPILPFNFADYAQSIRTAVFQIFKNQTSDYNYTSLLLAISQLEITANQLRQNSANLVDILQQREVNDRLMKTEQLFLGDAQLSGSEWYRHVIFSPSFNNSYPSIAFPAIINAIETSQPPEMVQFIIQRVAQVISNAARFLNDDLFSLNFK